jgi:hypothetical protein
VWQLLIAANLEMKAWHAMTAIHVLSMICAISVCVVDLLLQMVQSAMIIMRVRKPTYVNQDYVWALSRLIVNAIQEIAIRIMVDAQEHWKQDLVMIRMLAQLEITVREELVLAAQPWTAMTIISALMTHAILPQAVCTLFGIAKTIMSVRMIHAILLQVANIPQILHLAMMAIRAHWKIYVPEKNVNLDMAVIMAILVMEWKYA